MTEISDLLRRGCRGDHFCETIIPAGRLRFQHEEQSRPFGGGTPDRFLVIISPDGDFGDLVRLRQRVSGLAQPPFQPFFFG